jgi:hypothetical protein
MRAFCTSGPILANQLKRIGTRLSLHYQAGMALEVLPWSEASNIWLDSATGLPQKISVVRQDATGPAVPRFLLDYYFSNYQIVSGTYYPFQINISLNGTPWTTITISGVKFNTGLSESDFPVE